MSNIYIQEPPTNGKVLLKTTVGDIDLELWSKEAPKACRNFVQLCLEGYYNQTVFHRVVKNFIIQGGDPTGTGTGGESIYGTPFKDEFHSRLRFNRRGLVAMANAGPDDNASQFFFTLAATPELQNKHTIFAKVTRETIFNVLKIQETLTDKDERPLYLQKIIKVEVLHNPFPDIVPRLLAKSEEKKEDKKKKDKRSGVKNFKLLSFGEEAEEDEEAISEANKKYSGRSKSTHDILNDPKLSATPAISLSEIADQKKEDEENEENEEEQTEMVEGDRKLEDVETEGDRVEGQGDFGSRKRTVSSRSEESDDQLSGDEDLHRNPTVVSQAGMENLKKKLKGDKQSANSRDSAKIIKREVLLDEDTEDMEKVHIRKEIKALKKELQTAKNKQTKENEEENDKDGAIEIKSRNEYLQYHQKYQALKNQLPRKGSAREEFTMALLSKFQMRLAYAKDKVMERSETETDVKSEAEKNEARVEDVSDDWLTHKLQFESHAPNPAKDASTKTDDWFEIYDPRNPINKRRREASKESMRQKERH